MSFLLAEMEVEMADIDSNSSCKRLRDENEELREEPHHPISSTRIANQHAER